MTWVKICGTTNLADAQAAVAAGAEALGFIFAPSPRQISQEAAAEIMDALPATVQKIGVVVNQSPEALGRMAEKLRLDGVQLHGDEPGEKMSAYRSALSRRKIFKTIHVPQVLAAGDAYLYQYLQASEFFDAVLLDSGAPSQRGGTGVAFDWNATLPVISRIKEWMPVIIAGGLAPENVAGAIRLLKPWGVDVVSGVEREPGKKEAGRVQAFVQAVRSASAAGNSQQSAAPGLVTPSCSSKRRT